MALEGLRGLAISRRRDRHGPDHSVTDLIDHLVATHHYLVGEFPRLLELGGKVLATEGNAGRSSPT